MSAAGFVIAGWVIPGVVLLAYWLSVVWRIRRGERSEP